MTADARVRNYLGGFGRLLDRVEVTDRGGEGRDLDAGIASFVEWIVDLRSSGGKAILVGNGGSAAIVSHVHNDLCKAVGLRAVVFNEPPLLTALANDEGYDHVFARPTALWADAGDLLIAVSSGGESPNVINAVAVARQRRCRIVTFTGFTPTNRLRQLGDLNVYVPAATYGYVEMAHALVAHYVTDAASARIAASV